MATGELQLKDQCFMGIYTWRAIAFGMPTYVDDSIGCALGPHPPC